MVPQETIQAPAQQRLHTPSIKGVPKIPDTKEWGQEHDSDPVADRKTPLPWENIGRYHHKNGFMPRSIRLHPSEHSVVKKLKNSYNVSNKNQIAEVRHALPQIGISRILTQRSGHPLTLVRILHRALPRNIIPINDHAHWVMVQEFLYSVHPDSSQQPHQGHQ